MEVSIKKESKREMIISKGFFTKIRPIVSTKDSLKDIIPIKWETKDSSQTNKVIAYSAKEKKLKIFNLLPCLTVRSLLFIDPPTKLQ